MIKYFLLCSSLLLVLFSYAQAEEEEKLEKNSWTKRIVIDGNVAAQFGTSTVLGANPQIGYRISDGFLAGIGYSYNYFSFRYADGSKDSDQLYGPTAFARAVVMEDFFLRADYQSLKYVQSSFTDASGYNFNLDRLFLGGGYRQPINDRISVYMGLFIDVLSPNPTPVARGGIEAGLGSW